MDKGMTLFSRKNKASTRKADPETSHAAADRLNEVDGVTRQEQEVLTALARYGPCTAKELGVKMAVDKWYGKKVTFYTIKGILTEARKPHSRLKALVDDGKVTKAKHGTEYRYKVAE